MGIVLPFVVRQPAYFRIVAESLEMAVDKHVAVILFRIANPHESSIAGDGAMVEERRSPS